MEVYRMIKQGDEGFDYRFEKTLEPGETILVDMPKPTSNKRGINDIGWQTDNDELEVWGTLERNSDAALWDRVYISDDVNKTVRTLKFVNSSNGAARVVVRAILF